MEVKFVNSYEEELHILELNPLWTVERYMHYV